MTVISYPIPAYQNLPIEPENYLPSVFVISAITRGLTTTVITETDCNYVIGQQIRFNILLRNGIYQLNQMTGFVIELIGSTQFVVNIDSRFMDAFVSVSGGTQPQVVAIGTILTGKQNSNGSQDVDPTIPGSFKNIS